MIKLYYISVIMVIVMCFVWFYDFVKMVLFWYVFNMGYRFLYFMLVFYVFFWFVFDFGRWCLIYERCWRCVGLLIINSLGCKVYSRCLCRRIRFLVLIGMGMDGVGVNGVRLGIVCGVRG